MKQTSNYQLNQWDPEDRILREDFNADNGKIDAALAEIKAASPYVKLAEVTAQTQTGQIDLDVSGIDFSQYLKVELFVHSPTYAGGYNIQVNNMTSGYYRASCSGNGSGDSVTTTYLASVTRPGDGAFQLFPPHPQGNIRAVNWSIFAMGSIAMYSGYQYMAPCTWGELESFNISGSNFPAGTTVVLYGIKA